MSVNIITAGSNNNLVVNPVCLADPPLALTVLVTVGNEALIVDITDFVDVYVVGFIKLVDTVKVVRFVKLVCMEVLVASVGSNSVNGIDPMLPLVVGIAVEVGGNISLRGKLQ